MVFLRQCGRVIQYGLLNVTRDSLGSISSIFVNVITLFVIGVSMLSGLLLEDTLSRLSQKLDVTLYFVTEATEQQVLEFRDKIEDISQVVEVHYISKENALEEFKAKHENEVWLLEGLELLGNNPLRARVSFRAKQADDLEYITSYLQNEDLFSDNEIKIIDDIDYYKNRSVIERLDSLIHTVSKFASLIVSVLLLVSLLIVTNTLHLIIHANRDEIEVMQLLGASKSYIRFPFIVSSAVYGVVAGFIAIGMLYPFAAWLNTVTEKFFGGDGLLVYYTDNFYILSAEMILFGVLISVLAGFFAIWRYLK